MNEPVKLRGLGVAVATPFDASDHIDYDTLASHARHLAKHGADFLVALGTTAETPTLDAQEREQVSQTILDNAQGLPVVLGLGGNCTRNIVQEIEAKGSSLEKFAAILSVVPYYNKPSQQGMYHHFATIAQASPIPVILYNVPGRTGVNMLPETTLALARDFPGKIRAVKEASGSLEAIKEIIAGTPEGFDVLSGDDFMAHDTIRAGGHGVISVAGNAFPELMSQLAHLSENPETWTQAQEIFSRLKVMDKLLFRDGNPAGIKMALSLLPHSTWNPSVRLPLVEVSEQTAREMKAEIAQLL